MGRKPAPINRIDDTSQIPFNNTVTTDVSLGDLTVEMWLNFPPFVGGVLRVSLLGSHIISNIELSSYHPHTFNAEFLPFLVSH